MDRLPEGVAPYKRTPIFDQDSLPAALRSEHRTKPGVWALIHVVEGRLRYRILEPPSEQILTPDAPGVVTPAQPHAVEPVGRVRFFVEFHAVAAPDGSSHQASAGKPPAF
jgi:tellurite resistance-related uncharacterized protein